MPSSRKPSWRDILQPPPKDADADHEKKRRREAAASAARRRELEREFSVYRLPGALFDADGSKLPDSGSGSAPTRQDDARIEDHESFDDWMARTEAHRESRAELRRKMETDREAMSRLVDDLYDRPQETGSRSCHVCDGQGSYLGRYGYTQCDHCYGTGVLKKRYR